MFHVGIIPDGNRRYGKSKQLSMKDTYLTGFNKLKEVLKAIDQYCEHISVFLLSRDNLLKRTTEEINTIFRLIVQTDFEEIKKQNRNIRFIGSQEDVPADVLEKLHKIEDTHVESHKYVNFFFNYSSTDDINQALEKTSIKSYEQLRQHMWCQNIPDFSMIFRSGDSPRVSTFPLILMNYCNMYFSEKMWPEIKPEDIIKYIEHDKEQRFGK